MLLTKCLAQLATVACVVLTVAGCGGQSHADRAFMAACNAQESYAEDSGAPAVSCACVLRKARAAVGSTLGAGGDSNAYIDGEVATMRRYEREGDTAAAAVSFTIAFEREVNVC